ncbi:TIGR03986 family CRISPR-associated RAMP protein [Carbonactinospora thermoautotrophica]|uniref:TIGR03986 family type III CRISPR-associated RAMP protein n=1 Tax=Carbonactinospora thermoautotrophica TaxID=1469144 RepID=UPI0022706A7B|nr:TIGR03986 family CRISPR-associated RAMP protein [Carbonactinospora thermoautotrophica]MCX9191008.1 TIGR03986 family CRISPR-associated RAMP protein [Carbonactinospora thermoautotrophica]
MSEQTRTGVLAWDGDRKRLVIVEAGGGKPRPVSNPDRDLVPELRARFGPGLDGKRVDFTWRKGQPRQIRPAGASAPVRPAAPQPVAADSFLNPYTFVPALPRDRAGGDLADAVPIGHHRLAPHRWSGRIGVVLTVVTPLLVLDTARADRDPATGHATYPVLLRDGSPHLPATSVKGMLRAAYEAVTNSRLGVFTGHTDRLAFRMPAADSQRMVPARISDDGTKIVLLPGDTPPGGQTRPNPVLHAAWLPHYRGACVTYPDKTLPGHGDEVEAEVELVQHYRWNKWANRHEEDFQVWRVRSLARAGQAPPAPTGQPPQPRRAGRSYYEPTGRTKRIRGWVFVTNRNINRKHDERIFFTGEEPERIHELTGELRAQWENLIRDYRAAHREAEIWERPGKNGVVRPDEYIDDRPGRTAWSPHLYDEGYLALKPGDLCYAHVNDTGEIEGLYPVAVSRRLFRAAPEDLLHPTLRPATSLAELSPADRVFGWVAPSGPGSYRGHLRVGPVTCDQGPEAVADFGADGVPLAILGQPKPQQGRFYLAHSAQAPDRPLSPGLGKDRWYTEGQALRGRKVYRHHAGLPEGYWADPTEDRTQQLTGGRYQEYRRPRQGTEKGELTPDGRAFVTDPEKEQRDDQNRSIRGWIQPGTTFRFTLEVDNLSAVELGALAWLLRLPEGHYHRLGYGKPLGFGSVRLDIDPARTDLRSGEQWTAYYRTLRPDTSPSAEHAGEHASTILDQARHAFEQAAAGGQPVNQTPHLAAFLAAAQGRPGVAVHYPRVRPEGMPEDVPVPPDPRGQSFSWFVENERQERRRIRTDRGLSLPAGNEPLPIYPDSR